MGLFAIELEIADLFIVTYLIPSDRIRPHVPRVLPLATINNAAFVSVVIFRNSGLRFLPLPDFPFPFCQISVRTYVKIPESEEMAIYLLRVGITPTPRWLINPLLRMPFEDIKLEMDKRQDMKISYKLSGNWYGKLSMEAKDLKHTYYQLMPFPNPEAAINFLINPQVGFYGPEEELRRLKVAYHEPCPQICQVDNIMFPFLTSLRFMTKEDTLNPFNTFFIPHTKMMVFLPPKLFNKDN